jgi:hypothetical protein
LENSAAGGAAAGGGGGPKGLPQCAVLCCAVLCCAAAHTAAHRLGKRKRKPAPVVLAKNPPLRAYKATLLHSGKHPGYGRGPVDPDYPPQWSSGRLASLSHDEEHYQPLSRKGKRTGEWQRW